MLFFFSFVMKKIVLRVNCNRVSCMCVRLHHVPSIRLCSEYELDLYVRLCTLWHVSKWPQSISQSTFSWSGHTLLVWPHSMSMATICGYRHTLWVLSYFVGFAILCGSGHTPWALTQSVGLSTIRGPVQSVGLASLSDWPVCGPGHSLWACLFRGPGLSPWARPHCASGNSPWETGKSRMKLDDTEWKVTVQIRVKNTV